MTERKCFSDFNTNGSLDWLNWNVLPRSENIIFWARNLINLFLFPLNFIRVTNNQAVVSSWRINKMPDFNCICHLYVKNKIHLFVFHQINSPRIRGELIWWNTKKNVIKGCETHTELLVSRSQRTCKHFKTVTIMPETASIMSIAYGCTCLCYARIAWWSWYIEHPCGYMRL